MVKKCDLANPRIPCNRDKKKTQNNVRGGGIMGTFPNKDCPSVAAVIRSHASKGFHTCFAKFVCRNTNILSAFNLFFTQFCK